MTSYIIVCFVVTSCPDVSGSMFLSAAIGNMSHLLSDLPKTPPQEDPPSAFHKIVIFRRSKNATFKIHPYLNVSYR